MAIRLGMEAVRAADAQSVPVLVGAPLVLLLEPGGVARSLGLGTHGTKSRFPSRDQTWSPKAYEQTSHWRQSNAPLFFRYLLRRCVRRIPHNAPKRHGRVMFSPGVYGTCDLPGATAKTEAHVEVGASGATAASVTTAERF